MSVTYLSTAAPSDSDAIDENGVWIGSRRRGGRFVRYPDGEIRRVDRDFDCAVFDDPESLPDDEASVEYRFRAGALNVPGAEPTPDRVEAIARAMLVASPTSLIAVAHNRKGDVIAATITPASRGLTSAAFRAAFRSLPEKSRGVTFAARRNATREVREATMQAADSFLVRVLDFIIAERL
jgi:hypothetical protein